MKNTTKKNGQHALKEAFRISIYLLAVPFMLLAYMFHTHPEAGILYYTSAAFMMLILIFAAIYPFVRDMIELIEYFRNLFYRRDVEVPIFTSAIASSQLPHILETLKKSWEDTNRELTVKVMESRILFNTIPNIILILNDNLVITNANNAAHDALGANLVGRDIAELIENYNLVGLIRLALHEKTGKTLEIELNDVIPRYYLVKIEISGSEKHRPHQNVLLVFDDITEARRTELTFSDFVANASHEIRTPITAIMGISETLLSIGYDDKDAFNHFMPMIKLQADRMNQLINDLLNLAAIEKQLTSPLSDLVDINEVVEFSANQLAWELSKHKNTLDLKLDHSIPELIGDKNQLVQVIFNLINNAIKYGAHGKTIIVNSYVTRDFPMQASLINEYEEMVAVAVQDFGEGIAHENIERLTEKFFRVDKSRSKKIGGTGLGLSIVKQIVVRHHGFLDIKSTLGQGSTFTVYFPIYKDLPASLSENA